jgi:predicted MFS family arabinose efflux permease
MFFLGMAVFSMPVAFPVDRWSRRKAVALMTLVWSTFTFVTGLGRSYLTVLLPRMMVGVGRVAGLLLALDLELAGEPDEGDEDQDREGHVPR